MTSFDYYNRNAEKVFHEYQNYDAHHLYPMIKSYLHEGLKVLDVGAGSGRDAFWYANQGCVVTAVEPASDLLKLAESAHHHPSIHWINDGLPVLANVQYNEFDLIHMTGVWMHLSEDERKQAMNRLYGMLNDNGHIFCSIRLGPDTKNRVMYDTSDNDPILTDPRFERVYEDRQPVHRYGVDTVWLEIILRKR